MSPKKRQWQKNGKKMAKKERKKERKLLII